MTFRTFAVACLFAATAINSAFAQSDNNGPRDDRVHIEPRRSDSSIEDRMIRMVEDKSGGAVAIDVVVGPGYKCDSIMILVGRQIDGKWRTRHISGSGWVFGQRSSYGGMTFLEPGEYSVVSAQCKGGNSRNSYNGPHAKFQVNAGEVVNVGLLTLDVKMDNDLFHVSGTMKKSIGPMPPEGKAHLSKKYPQVFPKAVERLMTLVGPAETQFKKSGF